MITLQNKVAHLLLFGSMFFMSCGSNESAETYEVSGTENDSLVVLTQAQYELTRPEFCSAENRIISNVIHASGILDVAPQSKVSISAPMGGIVKETNLLQGSYVKKGQPVIVLQHNDYIQLQQDYKETLGQSEYLHTEYERQKELAAENINSEKTLQKIKADHQSALARLEGLEAKLRLLNIEPDQLKSGRIQSTVTLRSPIDGYVTKVLINIGSIVSADKVMLEIVNTQHLHAELTIFEKDLHKVRIGQKVTLHLASETNPRTATVYLVGKEIGTDRSVRVHCHLDQDDKNVIPGMYLKAILETDSTPVTALPEEAIVAYENKHYFFVESGKSGEGNYTFEMRQTAIGNTESGFTQVFLPEAFNKRSRVVCKGAYQLLSKLKNQSDE